MNTKICRLLGTTETEVSGLLEEARLAAKHFAEHPHDGLFHIGDEVYPTFFLDLAAEQLARYSLVFWDTTIYSPEDSTGSAMQEVDSREAYILQACMMILIGQGRVELCCQADLTPAEVALIGHVKVDELLVPIAFIGRVENELRNLVCSAGVTLSPTTLFTAEFLQSLDARERAMLMPCTFQLVRSGVLNLPVIELTDDEEEATE
jgi:hypothetical protein